MKIDKAIKAFISFSLSLSLFPACSSNNGGGSSAQTADLIVKTKADSLYAEWLEKVARGEISLLAAEALVPALKNRIRETGEELTLSVVPSDSFDFSQFKRQVIKKQNSTIQSMVMGGENVFSRSEDELHLTLPFQQDVGNYTEMGLDRLVDLGTLREESRRRLEAVFKVYDDAAKEAARAEAKKRIELAQIGSEVENLKNLNISEKEARVKKLLQNHQLDRIDNSGKPDVDTIVRKYLNDALYDILMNSSNTKDAVVAGAVTVYTYEKLVKTAEAFANFRDSVQKTWTEMKSAQAELSDGLQQVRTQISKYNLEELIRNPNALKEWSKSIAEGKNLIEGKVDSEKPTENEAAVSEAYKKVRDSSQKLAKNTRSLADAGQMLVDAGKLFLDEETVHRAQAVVDGVNKVSLIIDKLSSGGVTGIISAAGVALGGVGGGLDPAAARHAELSGKLDSILKNQKIMIELQIETIELQKKTLKAIADLAQMIDNNHRITMARLDGVDAQLATLTELAQSLNLSDFVACDQLIYGYVVKYPEDRLSFLHDGVQKALESFHSLNSLIAQGDPKQEYDRCRRGAQDIFLNESRMTLTMSYGATTTRNEVMDSQTGLINVDNVRFSPLYKIFKEKYPKQRRYRALHIPNQFMSMVPRMDQIYLNEAGTAAGQTQDEKSYLFEGNFLNPSMVINQVRTLVLISKLTSVLGNGDWSSDAPLEIKPYEKMKKEIQSVHALVQSAIAQESLLSGEPVLSSIYDRVMALMANPGSPEYASQLNSETCVEKEDFNRIGCLLNKNAILKRNFIQYFLHRRLSGDIQDPGSILQKNLGAAGVVTYRALYLEAQNYRNGMTSTQQLQQLGNLLYVKERDVPTLRLGQIELSLPTVEDYEADRIEYSITMRDLLALQKDLIQTRMKLEDIGLTEPERRILAEFIFNTIQ